MRNPTMLYKTLTYSVMHMVVAVGVAYAVSGNWAVALGIGLLEPLVQTVFYHLHERLWARTGSQESLSGMQPMQQAG